MKRNKLVAGVMLLVGVMSVTVAWALITTSAHNLSGGGYCNQRYFDKAFHKIFTALGQSYKYSVESSYFRTVNRVRI